MRKLKAGSNATVISARDCALIKTGTLVKLITATDTRQWLVEGIGRDGGICYETFYEKELKEVIE